VADGQTTDYGYQAASNRLASSTDWTYTRDANGNTTEQLAADNTGRLYAYNGHNRLVTATERAITLEGKGKNKTEVITDTELATYAYNGLGQRVAKTVDGTTTQYVYGTGGELLAELDGAGVSQREYVYLNGQLLATVTVTPTTPSGSGAELVVDNGDPGTASTGSWTSTTDRKNKQVGADYLTAAGGSGSTYRDNVR
jgi:YD repeat-containing protein